MIKIKLKKVLLATLTILLFKGLVGCGTQEPFDVEASGEMRFDGEKFHINIQTSLLDGSKFIYIITSSDSTEVDSITGKLIVEDGVINESIDASDLPEGLYGVMLYFAPDMQSDELQKIYGSKGENLRGESLKYNEERDIYELVTNLHFEKQ